jgi:hypothetical protein
MHLARTTAARGPIRIVATITRTVLGEGKRRIEDLSSDL